MGGVDHHRLAKFAANRSRRCFGRIRRPEHVANFLHRIRTFINKGNALFAARLVALIFRSVARRATRHEFNNVVELVVAKDWSENFAELLLFTRGKLEAELLFQRPFGARRDHVFQPGAQDVANRPVKFHGFGNAHAVDFDGDDIKARAGKKVDDVAGAAGRETEVVGLDQDESTNGCFARRINHGVVHHAAVCVGVLGPKFEFELGFLSIRGREDSGFEVTNITVVVENEIAVGIANSFAARTFGGNVADHGTHFAHGVFTLKEQHHDPAAAARFGVRYEVFENVRADEFLNGTVLRGIGGDNDFGVLVHELGARTEHARTHEFQAGTANEARENAPRAGFVQGVGRDDDVGEFLSHTNSSAYQLLGCGGGGGRCGRAG